MNRIRRPTLRDQLSSDYRDESSSENDEDKAVASTQTKRKRSELVPCSCQTYSVGDEPHFVTPRVKRSHEDKDQRLSLPL